MSSGECAVWYRIAESGEIHPVIYANEGHAAWEAADWDRAPEDLSVKKLAIGAQFSDGRTVRKEDWPAYAEAARFRAEQSYTADGRPAVPGSPLPEVQFTCPFTGDRLRRYGAALWLGVDQERLDPGAFTVYAQAKQAAGEWPDFGLRPISDDQLREALGEMPPGDDGHAWLSSVLSRR